MFELILWGITTGILLGFITGPAFFALLHASVSKGFKSGIAMALGIVFADAVYVVSILLGFNIILEKQLENVYIALFGCSLLIAYGFYLLLKKKRLSMEASYENTNKGKYFIKGFALIITNPSILLYWASIASAASSFTEKFNQSSMVILLLLFGTILSTQFSIDMLKCFFASRLRKIITPAIMNLMSKFVGLILIIAGIFLLDKLVFNLFVVHPAA